MVVASLVDQERHGKVPAEGEPGAADRVGSGLQGDVVIDRGIDHRVPIVAILIHDRGDAEVSARCKREVDALVQIVAPAIVKETRAEPVTASRGPVSRFVDIVPAQVYQRPQPPCPGVTIRYVAASSHSRSLSVGIGYAHVGVIVAPAGDMSIHFSHVAVVSRGVGHCSNPSPDSTESLTISPQVVAVLPRAVHQEADTEITCPLAAVLDFVVVIPGLVPEHAEPEKPRTLSEYPRFVAVVTRRIQEHADSENPRSLAGGGRRVAGVAVVAAQVDGDADGYRQRWRTADRALVGVVSPQVHYHRAVVQGVCVVARTGQYHHPEGRGELERQAPQIHIDRIQRSRQRPGSSLNGLHRLLCSVIEGDLVDEIRDPVDLGDIGLIPYLTCYNCLA